MVLITKKPVAHRAILHSGRWIDWKNVKNYNRTFNLAAKINRTILIILRIDFRKHFFQPFFGGRFIHQVLLLGLFQVEKRVVKRE